ncbi:type I-E CRISPR-associated protein Cse2/CasB [Bowmanella pacifica]|uniref:Type I-E CRISPR-associated protein Cse2/CasB n=1 Tax=Bowmanella pacifica TaxID=502051 RepID=A0A918DHM3_9ALTE|nr:type I-E CRISPR-associated protein Cse2/CasB [Bowmanella pacifica]GGO67558.1 type I-E CRISPR-associated protein Cse2/CasB [Bowmanella pacifica]
MSEQPVYARHSLLQQQEIRLALLNWWEAMVLSPEQLKKHKRKAAPSKRRAELRRCDSPASVLLTDGFRSLWHALPEEVQADAADHRVMAWACIVGVLAYVETQTEKPFAASLGEVKEGTDKARVSEMRFQALQQAKTENEFFTRLHRLIKQIDRKVNVLSLADDILSWFDERYYRRAEMSSNNLAVRWALAYYKASQSH